MYQNPINEMLIALIVFSFEIVLALRTLDFTFKKPRVDLTFFPPVTSLGRSTSHRLC